ncbi:hypothetical protein EUTSA_v10008322mg [Eutrema salsugineum]|uniref:DUF4408 domain-containing protein n=1 Tax=Eutrema salsugineum TaxID=72664 RepID=V4MUN6_EUTSA|nr:uncharacterized protein LOC18993758 [Eutrema salsugineum]ESQ35731.1 hypothetical protein EUTSA_v10008322mg [Eutrema salsugineum]
MASWIKPVLISTGFVAMGMHLKVIVPVAVDFSQAPILLSSFTSWLKPPYLYVITNVIIVVIGVSSRYYRCITSNDGKDYEVSYGGDYKNHQTEQQIFHRAPPRRPETKDEDFSFFAATPPANIVVEEKERPEAVREKLAESEAEVEEEKRCLVEVAKPESMIPVEKPLVSARIGQRKPVKTTTAERNSLRALRVAKPKKNETLENTWKMIREGKPLTSYYRRLDTFGIGVSDSNKTKQFGGLKKSETFGDRTNYYLSPAVSRSRDELNRRSEAFIKKCNDERFESMRQDKEVARRGLSF